MSLAQTSIGVAVVASVLAAITGAVIPAPPPLPLVNVNSLSYAGGMVTQDRTVNADSAQWIIWAASVVSATTGQIVPGCEGANHWKYTPGQRSATLSLREWVGSSNCTLIDGGKYQLFVRFMAGGWQTDARSEIFVK